MLAKNHHIYILIILASCIFSQTLHSASQIRHFTSNVKAVALTFDDGPGSYTQPILDILKSEQVKATFYVMGVMAKQYPNIVKDIIAQGHDLGNHSMYHKKMSGRSVNSMLNDITMVDKILQNLGYNREITFRSPFGITSRNLNIALDKLNKKNILFDFLPQDWKPISANKIYVNVMKRLRPGLIITLHDGGKRRKNTVIATKMLIQAIKAKGYKFLTVSEFLKIHGKKRAKLIWADAKNR